VLSLRHRDRHRRWRRGSCGGLVEDRKGFLEDGGIDQERRGGVDGFAIVQFVWFACLYIMSNP